MKFLIAILILVGVSICQSRLAKPTLDSKKPFEFPKPKPPIFNAPPKACPVGKIDSGECGLKGRCSTRIRDISSRIINPSHPEADKCAGSHSHVVQIENKICNLRLTIENLELQNPTWAKECVRDFLFVLHENAPTHPICGQKSKQQIDIKVEAGDHVEILIVTQSDRHSWDITVEQIFCEDIKLNDPFPEVNDYCGMRNAEDELVVVPPTPVLEPETPETETETEAIRKKSKLVPSYLNFDISNCIQGPFRCYLEYLIMKEAARNPIKNKVINGYEAVANSWRFMVAMLKDGKRLMCGGSMISKEYCLTAGHCVANFEQNNVDVRGIRLAISAHNLDKPGGQTKLYEILKIVRHSGYNFVTNDVALIKIKPIEVNKFSGPICLPKNQETHYAGEMGYIIGWGLTAGSKTPSPTLQEARIPIVQNTRCQQDWAAFAGPEYNELIRHTNICAGGDKTATCNGDSGGPLLVKNSQGRYEQVGLVSFGPTGNCLIPDKALSVFTRVTSYVSWISMASAKSMRDKEPNLFNTIPLPTYTTCTSEK